MAIPKHNEMYVAALELLKAHDSLRLREFERPLAERFKLSEPEVLTEYESRNGKVFYDRIGWCLSYLNMAALVSKPARGVYQINEKGLAALADPMSVEERISEALSTRSPRKISKPSKVVTADTNPQEALYESAENIKNAVCEEIIDVVLAKSPREFESLVVKLLQRMGYGGAVASSGIVTQYSNDKGIDGIIKEDVLGLGKIHIQAKRYARDNCVSREEVQKFVGALAGVQSGKGVFITSSYYSKGAVEYADAINGTSAIVLIDGKQLANYIYDYGLGMQIEQTIELKKLDSDFWDELEDD